MVLTKLCFVCIMRIPQIDRKQRNAQKKPPMRKKQTAIVA